MKPKPLTIILIALSVIAAGFGGYWLWKRFKARNNAEGDKLSGNEPATADTNTTPGNTGAGNGTQPAPNQTRKSFNSSEYKAFADEIHKYMSPSMAWEDDEKATAILLKMKTDADINALVSAYGKRKNMAWGKEVQHTLQQVVWEDLSGFFVRQINDDYFRKGMKFQFQAT